jgi:hypothetical protein
VKLNSIKPGFAGAFRGRSEDGRQLLRQLPNVPQMHVSNTFSITKLEGLQLARAQHRSYKRIIRILKERAYVII